MDNRNNQTQETNQNSINIDNLIRFKEGNNKGHIDWISNIGKNLKFKYDDIIGELKIIDYIKKGQKVFIEYNNKTHIIKTFNLVNCKIGYILERNTSEYRYKEGDLVLTKTGYIKILECIKLNNKKEVPEKAYKYQCMNCNYIGNKTETHILNLTGCPECNDNVSYPEKYFTNFLKQINVEYIWQKSFDWSKRIRYDFYIPSINCIIETHGFEHYNKNLNWCNNNYEDVHLNDVYKETLANTNKIKYYVIIDCQKSNPEYIKESICNSNLISILKTNINNMDWNKCHINSCFSYVRVIADLWNEGYTTHKLITEKTGLSITSIKNYLKKATTLGLCCYDRNIMTRSTFKYNGRIHSNDKRIRCINTGEEFNSIKEATIKYSLYKSAINDYLSGKKHLTYAGKHPDTGEKLTWEYI